LFSETAIPNDSLFTHVLSHHDGSPAAIYKKHIPNMVRSVDKNNYQLYADYAYQVQKQTQEQVAKIIEECIEETKIKNICISGGYGLNVVANGYYISRFPGINFFFEPLADDTGNSLGAAMLAYRQMTEDNNIYPLKSTFFNGQEPEINPKLINKNISFKIDYKKTKINKISDLLVSNKSVAIFNGKSEAGPRALGNRSILFYPNLENSKDIVNEIKKREWYRPFAACIMKEDSSDYFEMLEIKDSPYMTISFACKKETKKLFPGIVHVDNSCRVQTVDEDNFYLYNLLKEVKKLTGHGILLNTSFNLAGSPLVETLDQALEVLLQSSLDYLWVPQNNILYWKNKLDKNTNV
jgi:carbamoyltransferase